MKVSKFTFDMSNIDLIKDSANTARRSDLDKILRVLKGNMVELPMFAGKIGSMHWHPLAKKTHWKMGEVKN